MALLKKILTQLKTLPLLPVIVIFCTVAAGFLRFYKLESSTQFLGDQGRDSLIVSQIFTKYDLVAIGPTTSVGNIYLGPLYYYFMLPFLWLSYPSPIGPVYAIAVIGTVTVFFLYFWGRKLVGERAAVFASFLCAFSVIAINLSRFSWNPNPTPFVMLFLLYMTFLAVTRHAKYWLGVGFAFAILLQLHYVTLLAGGAAGLLWMWQLISTWKAKQPVKPLLLSALGAFLIVIFSLTPLILFDLKQGGLNARAIESIFVGSENFAGTTAQTRSIIQVLKEMHGRSMHILYEFQIGKNRKFNTYLVLIVAAGTLVTLLQRKKDQYSIGFSIIVTYLVVGIIGFSLYRNSVFDHYIAFLFPCTFLFLGFFFDKLWQNSNTGKIIVVAALLFFLNYNVPLYSFKPTSATLDQLKLVATSIQQRVQPGQKYGVVLVSATKDYHAMNYRYFLSTNPQKEPLSYAEHGWADLLFIIDEEKKTKSPEETDIFEINSFNNPLVIERYVVPGGPNITVLQKMSTNK